MTIKTEKSIKALLYQNNNTFGSFIDKINQLRGLEVLFKGFLEKINPELIPYCRVANFREGCLVIQTDSAAWATKLRYLSSDLISLLRVEGKIHNLASIHLIIG